MKKSLLSIVAVAAPILSYAAPTPTFAPPPPLSVFKGAGVASHPFNIPRVSMEILPANPAKGLISPGAVSVVLEGSRIPSPPSLFRVGVDLNLYSVSDDGQENLILELRDIPASGQARTPGGPVSYLLRLDDKNAFPEPLKPGRYRAESVLNVWTPGGLTAGGAFTEPYPMEAGGAALNFRVSDINITSLSGIEGEVRTMARLVVTNPALGAQARTAAATIVKNHANAVRAWVANANFAPAGAPGKIPVTAVESRVPGVGVDGISFRMTGQVYTDLAIDQMARLQAIVAGGNRPYPVPGGVLYLSTTPPPKLFPVDPTAVVVGILAGK